MMYPCNPPMRSACKTKLKRKRQPRTLLHNVNALCGANEHQQRAAVNRTCCRRRKISFSACYHPTSCPNDQPNKPSKPSISNTGRTPEMRCGLLITHDDARMHPCNNTPTGTHPSMPHTFTPAIALVDRRRAPPRPESSPAQNHTKP